MPRAQQPRGREQALQLGEADRAAAEALARLSTIREGRVRAEERLAAAKQRLEVYAEEMRSVARVQAFRDFLVSKAQRWTY